MDRRFFNFMQFSYLWKYSVFPAEKLCGCIIRTYQHGIKELTETLSKTKFENAKDVLEKFCSDHQATIIVQGGGEEQQYGTPDEVSSEKEEMLSFAQEIQFSDLSLIHI